MQSRLPRKLVCVLYADVAEYSRLTEEDEEATHVVLAEYLDQFSSAIGTNSGRVVHYAGDAVLAKFPTAADALACATGVQRMLAQRNEALADHRRVRFRIGVNLGDVIEDRGDIYGDGVNVAARLEALAEPGGICVSDAVRTSAGERLDLSFEDMGEQHVKNIVHPIRVWRVALKKQYDAVVEIPDITQQIRFCASEDGTTLAYGISGTGTPLLKAPGFMTHLEYDWDSPVWGPFFRAIASNCNLIRFDQRGNGLSDRNPNEISVDAFVRDMEAVADAAGLDRFAIYGLSQGAGVAITYAVRHPERVAALILHGGYARGRLARSEMTEEDVRGQEALLTLIRTGWGQDNPAFRQMFSSLFIPTASAELMDSFNELMRVATMPDVAAQIMDVNARMDVSELLPRVQAPTLILHGRKDAVNPIAEGRRLAASIPNSRIVELDTANHITIHTEPAMQLVIDEIQRFLEEYASSTEGIGKGC
jgi:class 3 adenylate cyclase/pimeloyl-ACP methyl ester carboxylesterase